MTNRRISFAPGDQQQAPHTLRRPFFFLPDQQQECFLAHRPDPLDHLFAPTPAGAELREERIDLRIRIGAQRDPEALAACSRQFLEQRQRDHRHATPLTCQPLSRSPSTSRARMMVLAGYSDDRVTVTLSAPVRVASIYSALAVT